MKACDYFQWGISTRLHLTIALKRVKLISLPAAWSAIISSELDIFCPHAHVHLWKLKMRHLLSSCRDGWVTSLSIVIFLSFSFFLWEILCFLSGFFWVFLFFCLYLLFSHTLFSSFFVFIDSLYLFICLFIYSFIYLVSFFLSSSLYFSSFLFFSLLFINNFFLSIHLSITIILIITPQKGRIFFGLYCLSWILGTSTLNTS